MALVLLAMAARGLALWRFGERLADDPDGYLMLARSIAAGDGFGYPPGHPLGAPTAYRPPLYPMLLAGPVAAAGRSEALLPIFIGGLQLVLGSATVWLTVLTARRLISNGRALLAGLLVAIDPLLVYDTALVMTETTCALLVALLLWLSLRTGGSAQRFATGCAFGLCCLCRPTFWAFGLLAAVGWLWASRETVRTSAERSSPRPMGKPALAMIVGATLIVAPWVLRNAIAMGRPIVTTTHGGYTLLLAHNPFYTRQVVDKPWGAVWEVDADWDRWQALELRRRNPDVDFTRRSPANELLRDRTLSQVAREYIRAEPLTAIRASLTLVGRFWNIVPMQTATRPLSPAIRWLIGGYYAATLLGMIVGLLRLRRDEWLLWWPIPLLLLSFTAVHAVYWSDMRMRAPLVPAIALLAARGFIAKRQAAAIDAPPA